MSRLIVLFLLILNTTSISWAQDNETPHSVVHFIRKSGFHGNSCGTQIHLPNQKMFVLKRNTDIKYTLYSEGEILVTLTIHCGSMNMYQNGTVTTFRHKLQAKHGEEYYFLYDKHESFSQVTKEEAQPYLDKISETKTLEENIDFPINDNVENENEPKIAQGTGFLVNNQGYILTNHHVIDGAKKILIKGIKGDFTTSFEAKVIAVDPLNDIALLKVESKLITFDNPPYNLGSSLDTIKAEPVYALGYPMKDKMGQELKITDGIISSMTGYQNSVSMFQFSANVNPGNSGGPLMNKKGEVIGIVTAKTITGSEESISYAVKSDYVKLLLDQAGVDYESVENMLEKKELPQQLEAISSFIYTIETE